MKPLDFLADLRQRDIQIWADGDQLRCNAPAGVLTPELREELRKCKAEILKFLRSAQSLARQQRAIVPFQSRGSAAPIFAVAGHNGDVFCFRSLAQHLGEDQPFFGLQPPGLDGQAEPLRRVEELADYFADQIRTLRPDGPYVIVGYCAGGTIAWELARALLRQGAEVRVLALFGSPFPTSYRFLPQMRQRLAQFGVRMAGHARALTSLPEPQWRGYLADRLRNFKARRAAQTQAAADPVLAWRDQVGQATLAAIRRYSPALFSGHLSFFWPCRDHVGNALAKWSSIAQDTEKFFGPDGCDGATMLRDPFAATFADLFRRSLQGIANRQTAPLRQSLAMPPGWETGQMEAQSL
jgi:thioesterase domain-containing protein